MEATEREQELFDAVKVLDNRIQLVDNVPRVSLVDWRSGTQWCLCAKVWSEKHGQALFVETSYDERLLDGDGGASVAAAVLWGESHGAGMKAAFEWEEAHGAPSAVVHDD